MEGTEREHSNLLANDSSGPDMGRRKDPGNFVLTSGTVTLDQASLRDAGPGRSLWPLRPFTLPTIVGPLEILPGTKVFVGA
jgi:hypothetical protein